MRTFTVKHGNGDEEIQADNCEAKDGRIVFTSIDKDVEGAEPHIVASFAGSYVHSVREKKQEKKEEKKEEKKDQPEPVKTAGDNPPANAA